ncbi:MerR family transcriptional regulator [Limosilactobacillus secaliphilus]|uniref:MerR family transcriptional regulator n=1 Tax=Limosilactobacillus secaliphilus TaxID=396268 RepID=A0A0R2I0G0_9LACO|nr:MerR family transcriptional regulator [Limosilactobacillus secaliphilus]KRN58577.1 MerR family transcriptional regulator [Limosilactobacillus secaliphilus]
MYSSGQLAKQCHTSIRTVQYYDAKGLLIAKRTANNRREYDEADRLRLQQILAYRQLGFQLKDIQQLINNDHNSQLLSSLIDQQIHALHDQQRLTTSQLEGLKYLKKKVQSPVDFSTNVQEKVASNMKMTSKLHRLRLRILSWGAIVDCLLWGSLIYVFYQGASGWWFVFGLLCSLIIAGEITYSYYQHSMYLCPHCQSEFVPNFKSWIFAAHTPNTRKLICPHCQQKNFCVEEYR